MPEATVQTRASRGRPLVIHTTRPIVITIDGPAGTGKSSVARALAARLGLDFLDTGAMYRAAAAVVIDQGVDQRDAGAIVKAVASADIQFDWSRDPPRILAFSRPLEARVRDADVTAIVSQIAGIPELRRHLVAKQRLIANQHRRLVTEGRDQGSVVFRTRR
jgi:cytidylate kinase